MPSSQPAQAHLAGTTAKTCTKARAACSNKPSDAEHFDYIIVMDDNNLRETEKQLGFHPGKIFKLTDLIPDSGYNHVPDPWYTGDFDETYRLVDAGSLALLEKLKQA